MKSNDEQVEIEYQYDRLRYYKEKNKELYNFYKDGNKINIRIVNIELPTGEVESLATNLSENIFSLEDLDYIYMTRWNSEINYHELKESMKITNIWIDKETNNNIYEMSSYREQIDMERLPEHIAIIMDGNGRWAKAQGLPRTAGHVEGVATVKRITEECTRLGVKFLTLYTFSTENWDRPEEEIEALMNLVITKLEDEIFMKNNVRFRMIGEMDRLPAGVRKRVQECMERTAGNTRMTVITALSYSSRWEITQTMKEMARKAIAGELRPEEITEDYVSRHLLTNFMPDPELLIRTGGELRISNYLLWQCAYSEFYFCDTFWPAFHEEDLHKAIVEYQSRQRRFGKTGEQVETATDEM